MIRHFGRTFTALFAVFAVLAASSTARAATIMVDTLADGSVTNLCTLHDAITAANTTTTTNGCVAGTGNDAIQFSVTGTIALMATLPAVTGTLSITGPTGAPGITIDGGSAMQIMQVNSGAALSLQYLTLTHGSVTAVGSADGEGGAISNQGMLNVSDCTLSANKATGGASSPSGGIGYGGAISNQGTLTVSDCTFSANQATGGAGTPSAGNGGGGAIYNSAILTVTNSTFASNQATGGSGPAEGQGAGGAIFSLNTRLTVTNSTFSANQAVGRIPIGGAIVVDGGTANFKSTILAANIPDNCGAGAVTDAGYNISDDTSCGFSKTGSANNGDGVNPMLASGPADNGGPTMTIALLATSPAVDAIPVADCTDQSSPTPQLITTDQRGLPRPDPEDLALPACDIGAFELQSPTSCTTPPTISKVASSPTNLGRATGKLVPVKVKVTAADVCDSAAPTCALISITSNQPLTREDARITGALTALLEAERRPDGTELASTESLPGKRFYHLNVRCTDKSGNAAAGSALSFVLP